MHALLRVVDRMIAVDCGRKLIEGDPHEVMASDEVRAVYLGDDFGERRMSDGGRHERTVLDIDGLDAGYGDFQALFGIDLHVAEAETVSIIGANGAGKSTLLKAIAGLVPSRWTATIRYRGQSLAGVAGAPARRRRHLARAGRPPHLPVADRRGEPHRRRPHRPAGAVEQAAGARRVPVARRNLRAAISSAACRAASSRRWRSPAR